MQSSTIKLSSCVCEAPEARKSQTFPTFAVAVVAFSCLVCTSCLFFGAFSIGPDEEATLGCSFPNDAVTSESFKTLLIFALGYASSLAVKNRQQLASKFDNVLCTANAKLSSAATYATSMASSVRANPESFQQMKDVMVIVMTGTLCTVCIVWLIISAFMAEPDTDPSEGGLASESSLTMRAFTLGWMFLLSLKLRNELVGLVGNCCLLQPW